MEAALEERPLIEGSATEVDSGSNPPAETGNAAVPAEQADAAPANQAQAMPAVRDVMSQPAVRRAMPAIRLSAYPVVPENVRMDAWWRYPGTFALLLGEYVRYIWSLMGLPVFT